MAEEIQMDPEIPAEEDVEANQLTRHPSQNSLDESSQKPSLHSDLYLDRPPYFNALHSAKMMQQMQHLRSDKVMCDVILEADGLEIPAHKIVLAAASPYFLAMFTNFDERKQDRILLHEISSVALQALVDYIYSCEIKVTEANVQPLLPASNLLQLTDVRDACCEFLQSQIHPSNCLGIRSFADMHCCDDLRKTADLFIMNNFSEVVDTDEFLSLSAERITELISSDQILVNSEEKVYECVLRWVNYNTEERQRYLPELMAQVRLPLLSREFLVNRVHNEPMLRPDSACKDYLIEALLFHLSKNGGVSPSVSSFRTKPRRPIGQPKMLLVVGGQAPKAIRSVEGYDLQTGRWVQLSEMPTKRCRCGVVALQGKVYVVGGFNGCLRVRSVSLYDPSTDCWQQSVNMEVRRSTLGVAILNDCIYAVGGFDGCTGLNTAEVFDPERGDWRMIEPMSVRRSSVGVAALNGILYAVGGYDGTSRQCLSSVEAYHPVSDRWFPMNSMVEARSGTGVGVLGGLLYAVGGHDGPHVRKSVEIYDPETNMWKFVGDMNSARRNAGVVTHDGLLYVIGGDDGTITLSSVEVYDPKTDTWTMFSEEMAAARSYAGVVVTDLARLGDASYHPNAALSVAPLEDL